RLGQEAGAGHRVLGLRVPDGVREVRRALEAVAAAKVTDLGLVAIEGGHVEQAARSRLPGQLAEEKVRLERTVEETLLVFELGAKRRRSVCGWPPGADAVGAR